jgi:pre-mRNA-splicing helicase BRR2
MNSDVTVEVYTLSLKERTKLKGLLEVVSSSAEFESIPIRRHEDTLLRRIYDRVPVKLDRADFEAPHFKTFLLLQAHFSRLQLPPDLAADQILVLEKVLNLLSACVDVLSSNAWLNALGAMDLSQMCVQAMWETDSPLKQVPHFDSDASESCSHNINCSHCFLISRLSRGARELVLSPCMTSWRWKTKIATSFCK